MPRTADHDARRAQIRDGVRSVALDAGLASVTIARVAGASGVSVGLVQHYFNSKEALLEHTYRHLVDTLEERVDRRVERAEAHQARIEQIIVEALAELLPLDRRRRDDAYLLAAFDAMALDNDSMLPAAADRQRWLHRRLAGAVANGKECGEVAPDRDVDTAARTLSAAAQGLTLQGLIDPTRSRRAALLAALRLPAAEIFAGRCHRA
ncbi:TetR/AcrR family transcriptional regulator [Flexivirga meconopsidis]|uniref:TetR/AcrR family transcriptional regulator n=1 Tax=Flexivirga meconopsidis TaxID=2977121 RepID=UPI0022404CFC|nr:TetR family transcriptional regulator C-terminal domain-containing protein [Flexivirga meconopsidis]